MLKKTISYTDYNGVKREESHYFNLDEHEIVSLQLSVNGGFQEVANKMLERQNVPALMSTFRDIILKAYGEKSADGVHFMKKDPVTGADLSIMFSQTRAFNTLFMELMDDETGEKVSEFMRGCVPADVAAKMVEEERKQKKQPLAIPMPSAETTTEAPTSANADI